MRNIFLILFLLTAGVFAAKSSAQAVILKADSIEVPCISTDTFLVPIYLDNFTNVSGLQFTLEWDTFRLDYAYITDLHPQFLGGAGFDSLPAIGSTTKLTFAWTNLAGLSLPPNTVLFKVAFTRIGGAPAPISFISDPTAIAVFNNMFNELQFEAYNGLVKPIDDVGPTITCPSNVVISGAGPTAVPNIPPTLADNCGTPDAGWTSAGTTVSNFPNDPDASGALFNIGLSTVTYTATDAGGNSATCSFDVLVEFSISNTDLTLIANSNNLVSCGDMVTVDVLAFNYDSIAGLQFSMEWLPSVLGFVSITNTNAALNIALGNFNTDSTGVGLLSFAWTSASLNGSSVPPGDVLFTLTYSVLGSGTVAFGNNPTQALAFTGTIFPPEEIPLITFGATVSVTDTITPTITCPADVMVQALGTTPVQGIAPVSVNDNCAAPLVGWSVAGATTGNFPNDPDASGGLFNIGASTVTYQATDAGGNTATCSFNVTVEFANNTTELTIVANSANAACGDSFGVDITAFNFETIAGVQFTLNWDPALFQYTSISNFNLPIGIGAGNFNIDSVGVGFITFAWTSSDLNGATVNNADVLFTLNFDLLNNTSSGIIFGDDPTIRVAFDGGTFAETPMLTLDGQVTVSDNVPPVISCPTPAPVDAPTGQLFATVNGLQPVALTDNCGGTPGLSYTQSGATTNSGTGNADGNYNAGTTTVVYTATDANGNTATCSFQVVVNADTPVVLQLDTVDLGCSGLPTQITVNLTVENFNDIIGLQFGLNWDPLVLNLLLPVSLQYLTAGPSPLFINVPNGTLTFFGGHPAWPDVPNDSAILTLTFDVLNANALATTNIFFVGPFDALSGSLQPVPVQTINGAFVFTLDMEPPVVTCPVDTVLTAPALACVASYIPVAPTAMDACGAIANTTIFPDTTIFSSGPPTILTYTVADDAGNTATCAFTVTVVHTNPPLVSGCPTFPIFGAAVALCQASVCWTPPVFQDACGLAGLVVVNDYDPCVLFVPGTTLVNYTATDIYGNSATCSFEVIVFDLTTPTLTCPTDTVITPLNGCSEIVNFVMPVATDHCDTDVEIVCSDTSGTLFSGITTITCAATDNYNNTAFCSWTITVLDTQGPIFSNGCPPNVNVVSASGNCGANPVWQAPMVIDSCDQNVSLVPSQMSGSFFPVLGSPHTVTYTATDDLGNATTCTFTVTVADSTKPTILMPCPPPIVRVLPVDSCTVTLGWTPPTMTDNCGPVTLTSNLSPGIFPTGDTTVVYTATDASGNSVSCSFNVSVKDVVPPFFIDCPTMPILVPNGNPCGNLVDFDLPIGKDICTPDDELRYSGSYDTTTFFPVGTTTFPYRVTDKSGNFVECFITITIMGVVPHIENVPDTIFVGVCGSLVSWPPLTPVGFCPPITIDSTHTHGVFPFGTTTVTYMASDSLNSATATFLVIVSEDVEPVFDCPVSPIVVNIGGGIVSDPSDFLLSADTTAGCDAVELTFDLPNATDNCVTPTVTQLQGFPSGSLFPLGFNNLVFRAVDSSGNLSQCAVNIEVTGLPALDLTANPNPACTGDSVVITASNIPGAIYTWVGPVTSMTNIVTINNLSVQNDGQYILTANVNGCNTAPDTTEVFLTLPPEAENDLNYYINPGETIIFTSVLTNDNLSPAFDFEVCENSQLEGLIMNSDGTFSYTAGDEPGMVSFFYVVCTRTCELEDQAVVTITINDTKCVFIPNIITPNGDDINDWFTIQCIDTGLFRENSLVVYSQWGDKVYEASPYSNDPDEAWRGTLDGEDGKDLPDGVYYYIFKPGPNVAPMKGFVQIFR
ncbi:MAG: HYR domain-containing protein [Saprospiraceae bacterium]